MRLHLRRAMPAVTDGEHPERRPLRLRAAALALTVVGLTGGAVVAMAPAALANASDNAGFLTHLNSLRAQHGLPALTLSSDLISIATTHSAAMAAQETIFHNTNLANEVANWEVLGENVGMGPSVSGIDQAFDNSPGHYANEVSSAYTQVGIGTAYDNRGYLYVTLDFRKPMYASAPAPVAVVRQPVTALPTVVHIAAPTSSAPAHAAPAARRPLVRHLVAAPNGNDPLARALKFNDALARLAS